MIDSSTMPVVGRYLLGERIAGGGMAAIHLAKLLGPSGFSRTVAVKQLHAHYAADDHFVDMFIDEARLAARVQHPNVVGMIDIVRTRGELLLVMEYVHGVSLATLLAHGRRDGAAVPIAVATAIMIDVLRGLDAAHEATSEDGAPLALVHRDVSPQNIIVGADGVARVIDFGVAKASGRLAASTTTGNVKGKLAYMAPEQIRGRPVTRQADVFSAGVVLWEVLVGRRLFHGEDGHVIEQILLGEVDPPSAIAPELPHAIDDVVLGALEHDLARRTKTTRELASALAQCVRVASVTEVAAWVRAVGGGPLTELERKVIDFENDRVPSPEEPSAGPRSSERALSDTSMSAPIPRGAVRGSEASGTHGRAWLLAGVALALVVGIGALRARRPDTTSGAASEAPPPLAPFVATESRPSVTADAPNTPSSSPPKALASVARTKSASPGTPAPPQHRRSSPADPRGDCTRPFTLDAAGRKVYRRECLR